jgi:hypothetical protein
MALSVQFPLGPIVQLGDHFQQALRGDRGGRFVRVLTGTGPPPDDATAQEEDAGPDQP